MASVCSSSKRLGGPTGRGGGLASENFAWVGLGGKKPNPGLLVPDASRQEAEANYKRVQERPADSMGGLGADLARHQLVLVVLHSREGDIGGGAAECSIQPDGDVRQRCALDLGDGARVAQPDWEGGDPGRGLPCRGAPRAVAGSWRHLLSGTAAIPLTSRVPCRCSA